MAGLLLPDNVSEMIDDLEGEKKRKAKYFVSVILNVSVALSRGPWEDPEKLISSPVYLAIGVVIRRECSRILGKLDILRRR